MPQMSPMFWSVFPLVMMVLLVVGTVFVEFESLIMDVDNEHVIEKTGISW